MTVETLRSDLVTYILNPIMALLFFAAMVVFMWGIIEFLGYLGDGHDKDKGKQRMLWGIVGMFVMASAVAILNLVLGTIGGPSAGSIPPTL